MNQMKRYKVAIIGAGWYGCHIGAELIRHGHEVVIYEKDKKVFQGASGKNQFRLHLGFHYPRSEITRSQSSSCYNEFLERYPHLFYKVTNNAYGISSKGSLVDFPTYKLIMENGCDANFETIDPSSIGLQNVDGVLLCNEGALLSKEPEQFFSELLENNLRLNHMVKKIIPVVDDCNRSIGIKIDNDHFDWCVDCTYGQMQGIPGINIMYEPCLTFIYRRKHRNSMNNCNAFTIMDGPFVSLFPYFQNYADATGDLYRLHTLTHVTHTHLGKFETFEEVEKFFEKLTEDEILSRRPAFEKDISHFLPSFCNDYDYHGYFLSCKTKLESSSDSRETICLKNDRTIHVLSGKVNTIFDAERQVFDIIRST